MAMSLLAGAELLEEIGAICGLPHHACRCRRRPGVLIVVGPRLAEPPTSADAAARRPL
jgi:hypothetical protein